jgi:hypothetical protein
MLQGFEEYAALLKRTSVLASNPWIKSRTLRSLHFVEMPFEAQGDTSKVLTRA